MYAVHKLIDKSSALKISTSLFLHICKWLRTLHWKNDYIYMCMFRRNWHGLLWWLKLYILTIDRFSNIMSYKYVLLYLAIFNKRNIKHSICFIVIVENILKSQLPKYKGKSLLESWFKPKLLPQLFFIITSSDHWGLTHPYKLSFQ